MLDEYLATRNRKFDDKTRHALKRVIVDGIRQKEAAEEVGMMKQQLWMAIRTFNRFVEAKERKNAEGV
jgi:hypothetical protein